MGSDFWNIGDRVLVTERNLLDEDHDGLPDGWEARFGLAILSHDPATAAGGDPDADGVTNAAELVAGTHPLGLPSATRYLAEGATGALFDTWIALANPGTQPATVLLRFLGQGDWTRAAVVAVPPGSIRRVHVNAIPDLGTDAFSTVIESDVPVVVERDMMWDRTWWYGSHADAAVESPATTWYFAEGATHSSFDLFYLLQNPGATAADVKVTYLRPSPLPPIERTYVVAPGSRFNVWVDTEPGLEAADVSAVIESTNGVPIIAERAMYSSAPGRVFSAGHDAAGAIAPALEWSLAEGATGPYFDLFVLVANPGAQAADLEARFLLPDGRVIPRQYQVAPRSRFNIWVDHEGSDLSNTAVSTVVSSTNGVPVIVERAMWWPGPTAATWAEAHAALASTTPAARWAFAAGLVGSPAIDGSPITVRAQHDMWGPNFGLDMTLAFADGSFLQRRVLMPVGDVRVFDPLAEFPEAAGRPFVVHFESRSRTLCGPHSCFSLYPVAIEIEGGRAVDAHGLQWLSEGPATDTYFLIANLGADAAAVRVTLLYENGAGPSKIYEVAAFSRFNVDTRAEFPEAVGRAFGAVIESLGAPPARLVVERAVYSRAFGQPWAAGSCAMGTRLP